MNSEGRFNVTASMLMLKDIKTRIEHVERGYQLLKRKGDALRIKGRAAAAELAQIQSILHNNLKEAYITLAAIKFTNGESNALVLENIGEAQVRVQRSTDNVFGVNTTSLEVIEEITSVDALQYAGLGAGGHRTAEAKRAFRQVIGILVKFASLRNTCMILDAAFKSTLRKLNGIEKVILPKLKNTEIYIITEMDEREREDFHRLKIMKAKKHRSQFLAANLRRSVLSGGEGQDEGNSNDNPAGDAPSSEYFTASSTPLELQDVDNPCKRPYAEPGDLSVWVDEDILF